MHFTSSILITIALAGLAPIIVRLLGSRAKWVLTTGPLACLLIFGYEFSQLPRAGSKVIEYGWVPSLNVNLSFYLDGFGLLFALLISAVGTMVFLYAGGLAGGES